jgi:hippurate hydrolase
LPAGQFGLRTGPIMAAGSRLKITITGKGAHAAQPHLGLDPIPLACSMVLQCQTIAARHKDPVDPAVISVCMFHAGDTDNVIPDRAELRGTIRTLSSTLAAEAAGRHPPHVPCAGRRLWRQGRGGILPVLPGHHQHPGRD